METNENQIALAVATGEPERFTELYDLYADRIYRFAYYRSRHRETAEDLTSQTFIKALEKISSFNPEKGNFGVWIYRIARNTVYDHFRSDKATSELNEDLAAPSTVERDTENKILLDKVETYLGKLDPKHRELVILRVWDGLTFSEIAQITGKSEAASKMAYSRIMARLNQEVPALVLLAGLAATINLKTL